MLDSPWVEGWGVDFRVVSDTHRFGLFVPDEDPPGNQVTTRVQKFLLLSHGRQRFALMLTPRSIPGEFVSPRILRHAPSCYILVTQHAQMKWEVKGRRADVNKKTNQTESSSARLLWGCSDYSVIWRWPERREQQESVAFERMHEALGEVV